MTAIDVLRSHNIAAEDQFNYVEVPFDDRFVAVEIYRNGERRVRYREFYFIVDTKEDKVYYGDYDLPDGVNVERIKRGIEQAIEPYQKR